MNRYLLKQNIIGLLFFTCLFVGCDNAEYSVLHNQAYISQTGTNPNTALKVFIDQDLVTANLNVRLSDPAEKDYNFEFVEDAELLAKYNEVNYTSYKFLPAEQYNFKGKEAVIKQGEVLSESSGLEILPLTQEMKDSGNKYAIAFCLIEDLSLSEWTLEFCVNMSKLGKKVGELNNQALFDGSSSLGESDGQIYTRFGDAPIEGNRLQIKTQGLQMNSATLFEEDKWYQIAWVCTSSKLYLYVDGKLDNSIDVPGKVTNLSKTKCKIGNTEYLKADVQMSELNNVL